MIFRISLQLLVAALCLSLASGLSAESTITYQGQLQNNTGPVTDTVDMSFSLWSAESGGNEISSVSIAQVEVVDGLFQVQLDFGAAAFSNGPRFLEVNVQGSTLGPRQKVTAVPVALRALNADETYWAEISDGNIRYSGGRVTVGAGLLSRFGVNADADETVLLARTGGETALRVNENRGVAVGANYGASGVPDRGLRVWGGTVLNSHLDVGGHLGVSGNVDVDGTAAFGNSVSVGTFAGGQRLGVGTTSPWNTLHVVSGAGDSPLRVMVEDNATTSAVLRGYANRGVAIGHSYAESEVPGRGLIVRGEIHVRDLPWRGSDPGSNVCPEAIDGGPVWRLVRCMPDSSSARFKEDVRPLEGTADLVRALRPVQYSWKDSGRDDIGLIAEEVAEVVPDIVLRDDDGDILGFRYNRLGALLIGAFQELEREQREQMARLQVENDRLKVRLEQAEAAVAAVEEVTARNAELERRLAGLEGFLLEGRELSAK